jgi:hypothetical protein
VQGFARWLTAGTPAHTPLESHPLSPAAAHLDAWVCVAQLGVVGHHVSTTIIAAGEFEAQGLGEVHLGQQAAAQQLL